MRPQSLFPLFADLTTLKGVGPKLAELMARAVGGPRVKDVLFTPPTGLVDRTRRALISDAGDAGGVVTLEGEVEAHVPRPTMKQPYIVRLRDETGFLHLVFFNARPDYLMRVLPVGARRVVSGKAERFGSEIQMVHPDLIAVPGEIADADLLQPVYPLTAGLSGAVMRKAVAGALETAPDLPEWIDAALAAREGWAGWRASLLALHAPQGADDLEPQSPARARLAFDELFAHQLALKLARRERRARKGRALTGDGAKVRAVLDHAPFTPTGAQLRAFEAVRADLEAPLRMMRLIHGDVGSGKTFVAALAAAHAAEAGGQTALMAPTEIVARQHAGVLEALLAPAGIRVIALTGRDKGARRAELLAQMASGEAHVVCGTHALFQDAVEFHDLALAVIDEQHRFGVSDRRRLTLKGAAPDVLAMSATPIPRTLTLAAFGDLDVSRLDEKPAGRIAPDTRVVSAKRLAEVVEGLKRALSQGERAYWVCPLVEESDVSDLAAAEARHHMLGEMLPGRRVGLVHGRMPARDKQKAAEDFRAGLIDVLVATTVIEVGVDAPDATIMVIEHAERFGLAQLHQLRGRVGRGDKASTCLLLYHGQPGETARARLDIMRRTDDGFEIAEEDWRLRGSGDPLGLRQSGLPDYRLADLAAHASLLTLADEAARYETAREDVFAGERGEALRTLLYLFERDEGVRLMRSG
ncbi:ATP-dependent DNA helicase RecG [Alkalicaulis satelles]|uniref:Probable DNA 3'-5' helicase RecG n=1 Tax=Alkalicaulis satelles TaxID=2609175 RepID=A0A5M6ZJB8_9PROT|nr:ATP-dependent DNA helicase RecG [Alkalicaulis satelles]KAA5804879.1 ATP-dependent DNA helicase RecG [Alkalicaulis satelles]